MKPPRVERFRDLGMGTPIDAVGGDLPPLPMPAARLYTQGRYRRASVLPGKGEPLFTAEQYREGQRAAVESNRAQQGEPVAERDESFVYLATARSGETCYFGYHSFASAWAGKNGSVKEIKLPVRDFSVVEESAIKEAAPADAAIHDAAALMWDAALSEVGLYVASHCPDGEAHAAHIMEMKMPKLTTRRAPVEDAREQPQGEAKGA